VKRYTLNKSYGPWSAGTEVEIVTAESFEDSVAVVGVAPVNPGIHGYATMFDIPVEYLTVRRNRTDEIASPTREQKRGQNRRDKAGQ